MYGNVDNNKQELEKNRIHVSTCLIKNFIMVRIITPRYTET